MTEFLQWLVSESPIMGWPWGALLVLGLYVLAQAIVAATPTPKDDQWLKKVIQLGGLLSPKDVPGWLKKPWRIIVQQQKTEESDETQD